MVYQIWLMRILFSFILLFKHFLNRRLSTIKKITYLCFFARSADREKTMLEREQEEDGDPLQGTGKAAEGPDHLLLLQAAWIWSQRKRISYHTTVAHKRRTRMEPQQIPSMFWRLSWRMRVFAAFRSWPTVPRRQCHGSAPHNLCPLCLPSTQEMHRPSPFNRNNHFTGQLGLQAVLTHEVPCASVHVYNVYVYTYVKMYVCVKTYVCVKMYTAS